VLVLNSTGGNGGNGGDNFAGSGGRKGTGGQGGPIFYQGPITINPTRGFSDHNASPGLLLISQAAAASTVSIAGQPSRGSERPYSVSLQSGLSPFRQPKGLKSNTQYIMSRFTCKTLQQTYNGLFLSASIKASFS
jgi:hypothetical protein